MPVPLIKHSLAASLSTKMRASASQPARPQVHGDSAAGYHLGLVDDPPLLASLHPCLHDGVTHYTTEELLAGHRLVEQHAADPDDTILFRTVREDQRGGARPRSSAVLGGALVKYLGQNQRCSVATSSIKAGPADCLRQVLERCCPAPPEALSTCKVERPPQGLNRSGTHLPRPDDLLNLLADPLSSLRPVRRAPPTRSDRVEQPDQDGPGGEDRVPRAEEPP